MFMSVSCSVNFHVFVDVCSAFDGAHVNEVMHTQLKCLCLLCFAVAVDVKLPASASQPRPAGQAVRRADWRRLANVSHGTIPLGQITHLTDSESETASFLEMLSKEDIAAYHRDGFLVVKDWLSRDEIQSLRSSAEQLLKDFDESTVSVFSTNEQTRTSDAYFLESGDKVSFKERPFASIQRWRNNKVRY